jgi:hypothetical protein
MSIGMSIGIEEGEVRATKDPCERILYYLPVGCQSQSSVRYLGR